MTTAAQRAREVERAARAFAAATAGDAIRVTFNDDDPERTRGLSRVFVGLGATIDAMPAVLRASGIPAIRAEFRRNFADERGRRPWAPLAPRTVEERIRLGYPGRRPILKRTGALERHVVNAPAMVLRVPTGLELRIAPGERVNGVAKYRPLALGTGTMPARPMVVLPAPAANRVTSAISRALRERAIAAGLG